jgi:ribosomal protein L40E
MKDKVYKDWQEGMTQAEISAKYNITLKVCPECEALFKPRSEKEKCCSDKCHIKAIYKRIVLGKKQTFEEYLQTIDIKDYAKLQMKETLMMIAR